MHRTATIIEALAEHGHGAIGGMLPLRDCTRITLGRSWAEGGRFIATEAGHLADGSLHEVNGVTYRLRLIGRACAQDAA